MILVQKWPFIELFFLSNIGQEKVFSDILERKNAFLGYKNKKLKKSKYWHFSKGVNPWFRSKNAIFPFFFCNIDQENVFYDILQQKITFLCHKNITHGFGRKMAIFPTFVFLGNIDQENVFYDILQQKIAFLCYKNITFKKSKNSHFSKSVNPWF